jgi:hypothetical protein
MCCRLPASFIVCSLTAVLRCRVLLRCSYGFVVYSDPNVTDVACAGLNGLKMGDRTLTVRRAAEVGGWHLDVMCSRGDSRVHVGGAAAAAHM